MISNDYRNTLYCPDYADIVQKKNDLCKKIKEKYPNTTNFYRKIAGKGSEYGNNFKEIYNDKCCYCGVSISNSSIQLFEVDHFICKSSFDERSKQVGQLSNLVLSCKKCNRAKSNFAWDEAYSSKFNVDDGSICKLFYRDKHYGIKIHKKYKSDNAICKFYDVLKFNDDVRKLDFLLMSMRGFYKKHKIEIMSECILLLSEHRNGLY